MLPSFFAFHTVARIYYFINSSNHFLTWGFGVLGYAKAFGVTVVADAEVSDAKVLHAISVAAEYLDNNGDGYADSPVACDLEKNKALLHMTGTNAAAEKVTSDDKFMDRI